MTGSMLELPERVYELQKHGHDVFLHCDFIQGLNTNTEEALLYIQDVIGAQGIISTKGSTIRNANKIGLKTIQRIFLDTLSLNRVWKTDRELKHLSTWRKRKQMRFPE